MAEYRERVVRRLKRLKNRTSRSGPDDTDTGQLRELRGRVNELEHEVMENRQLARRIAELTDVVEQLLLPEDVRDSRRLEARLGQIRARH
jgi:hypothetical protein